MPISDDSRLSNAGLAGLAIAIGIVVALAATMFAMKLKEKNRSAEAYDYVVNLPSASEAEASLTNPEHPVLKIYVAEDGTYSVDEETLDEEALHKLIEERFNQAPGLRIAVRCHPDTKHLFLANVMAICRHVGVETRHIAVTTER